MLNKDIVTKITNQINYELFSAYLYLDISNFYADCNLNGFSNWFMIQTQEERVKLVYRIKIDLDNSRHELKSNMPADAVLTLE